MMPITGYAPPSDPQGWHTRIGDTVWGFWWTGERVISWRIPAERPVINVPEAARTT